PRERVGDEGGGGDGSELTDTSSFSEISATDLSEPGNPANPDNVAGNRRVHQHRHRRQAESSLTGPLRPAYQPAQTQLGMPAPRADPDSVMSIFSRQSKYLAAGSAKAEMPTKAGTSSPAMRAASASGRSSNTVNLVDLDLTTLKQPVITHSERLVHTQTASGQPIVAKARYTRLEATVTSHDHQDDDNQDVSSSASESAHTRGAVSLNAASKHSEGHGRLQRSNDASAKPEKANRQGSHKSGRSEAYSMSFQRCRARHYFSDTSSALSSNDEDEDGSTLVSGSHHRHSQSAAASAKKSAAHTGYNRQVSDGGQETDVSQMSEDEPRVMRSKLDSSASPRHNQHLHHHHAPHHPELTPASQARPQADGAVGPSSQGQGQGRLSPNSLANKLSAGLNHLESMEESLRQVVGMERVRAVALAQQETVSLAQVLKARQQEHSTELRQLQAHAQQEAREAT
ncbi:hypothetical protein EGW08_003796, partial [Elysia chlorotica]